MKRFMVAALGAGLLIVGSLGCSDKSTSKTETKSTSPGGETTTTTEREVKQTGNNPPAARP